MTACWLCIRQVSIFQLSSELSRLSLRAVAPTTPVRVWGPLRRESRVHERTIPVEPARDVTIRRATLPVSLARRSGWPSAAAGRCGKPQKALRSESRPLRGGDTLARHRQKSRSSKHHGAHLLPHPRLHASQRAALVPKKPTTKCRAADARLPAECGHTDGRLREERIHERRLPDAQAHDSGGWKAHALLALR